VFTGYIFVEFNSFTYILAYNYSEQIQSYTNIAQAYQHIIPNQEAAAIPKSPPPSKMSSKSLGIQSSSEEVLKCKEQF
jgi:hypothetical protein